MYGSYYQVGEEIFAEPYAALKRSAETNLFASWELPSDITQSYLGINPHKLPTIHELIKTKSQHIVSTYKDYVFHYSGGTDSESILRSIDDWKNLYCVTRGIPEADVEFRPAIEHNKALVNEHVIDWDLYNIWEDKDCPYKFKDFYSGFSPHWDDYLNPNSELFAVKGVDKPRLYRTKQSYYWIISDESDVANRPPHTDFYIDNIVPELAVKQAYSMKDFFKKTQLERFGWIEYKMTNTTLINNALGRIIPDWYVIAKTSEEWDNFAEMNYKHRICLEMAWTLGFKDLIYTWADTLNSCTAELKSAPHGIKIVKFKFKDIEVDLPNRIDRIGAIFKMNDTGLELMDHKDISKCI